MTTTDHQVIAELGTLAAQEHWSQTGDFLRRLDHGAPRVVMFAADAAGPLVGWLREQGIAAAEPRPLTVAEAEPGQLLAADRLIVALGAGRLLDVDEVEAVAAILDCPEGSRRIVLVGAAVDAAGWRAAERAVWRVLLGGSEDWHEQDLGPRGCLRWAPPGDDDEPRVARDRSALLTWLTGTGADPELDRMRALHALDLAEAEQSPPATAGAGVPAGRDRQLSRLGRSRRRITARLDALAASAAREVSATLETVRADLVAGTPHEIRVAVAGRSDLRLAASVTTTQLDRRTRDWLAGPYQAVGARVAEAFQAVADDLDELDWDAVTGDDPALAARRRSVPAALRRDPRLSVPVPRSSTSVPAPAAGDQLIGLLPVVGAVIGGAVGWMLPIPLVTTVAGAALGALGGRAVQHQWAGSATETWIGGNVPGAVGGALVALRESALDRLDTVIAERRAEAVGLLDDLENHLRRPHPAAGSGSDHRSSLAELRSSLS